MAATTAIFATPLLVWCFSACALVARCAYRNPSSRIASFSFRTSRENNHLTEPLPGAVRTKDELGDQQEQLRVSGYPRPGLGWIRADSAPWCGCLRRRLRQLLVRRDAASILQSARIGGGRGGRVPSVPGRPYAHRLCRRLCGGNTECPIRRGGLRRLPAARRGDHPVVSLRDAGGDPGLAIASFAADPGALVRADLP